MVKVAERHLVEKDVGSLNMFWVEVYWNHLLGTRFLVNREMVEIDRDRTPQEIETEGYVRYSFTLDIIKKSTQWLTLTPFHNDTFIFSFFFGD